MRLIASVITHVLQRAFNVTASDNYASLKFVLINLSMQTRGSL